MLTAKLAKRLEDEIMSKFEFEYDATRTELKNAAKYLKGTLNASDDDIIEMIGGLATVIAAEYGA